MKTSFFPVNVFQQQNNSKWKQKDSRFHGRTNPNSLIFAHKSCTTNVVFSIGSNLQLYPNYNNHFSCFQNIFRACIKTWTVDFLDKEASPPMAIFGSGSVICCYRVEHHGILLLCSGTPSSGQKFPHGTNNRKRVFQMNSMTTVGNLKYLTNIVPPAVFTFPILDNFMEHFLSNWLELRIFLSNNE